MGLARALVVNNNGVGAVGQVDIAATSPGLFALDGSGLGQAAALVFSQKTGLFSVNDATSPAKAGDIMILYLTGEGDYATLINPRTGYVVPSNLSPLPQLNQLPAVMIGGAAATVQYAGPAGGGTLGIPLIKSAGPPAPSTSESVPANMAMKGPSAQTRHALVVKDVTLNGSDHPT